MKEIWEIWLENIERREKDFENYLKNRKIKKETYAIKRSLRNEVEQIWENSARIFLLIAVMCFFCKKKSRSETER